MNELKNDITDKANKSDLLRIINENDEMKKSFTNFIPK